jgi:hypothetical protein
MTRAYIPDRDMPNLDKLKPAERQRAMKILHERVLVGRFLRDHPDEITDEAEGLPAHHLQHVRFRWSPTQRDDCIYCALGNQIGDRYMEGLIAPIYPTDDPAPEVEPPKRRITAELPIEGRLRSRRKELKRQ